MLKFVNSFVLLITDVYLYSDNNNIKTHIMKFTKVNNGNYKFEGLDTWTNKTIEGNIIKENVDIEISKSWQVVFGLDTENINRAFFGKSLTECKNWLK